MSTKQFGRAGQAPARRPKSLAEALVRSLYAVYGLRSLDRDNPSFGSHFALFVNVLNDALTYLGQPAAAKSLRLVNELRDEVVRVEERTGDSYSEIAFGIVEAHVLALGGSDSGLEVDPAELPSLNVLRALPDFNADFLQRAILKETALVTDKKADKKRRKAAVPENPDVMRLATLIRNNLKNPGETKIGIARGFTSGDEEKAQTLLRELRRFPNLLE